MWNEDFIDLSPLFWPLASAARTLDGDAFPQPEIIDAMLGTRAGVRFERQKPVSRRRRGARDPASMYDARIKAGCVPTRPGSWHDLMNALVWATFPTAKRALHDRQHELVVPSAPGESARRTREADTLALLDEGGVVIVSEAPFDDEARLTKAVAAHEAALIVFGHAIYEGIVLGREMPLASVVCVLGDPSADRAALLAGADRALALVVADRGRLMDPKELLRHRLGPDPARSGALFDSA